MEDVAHKVEAKAAVETRFLKYTFFKVARQWRSLPEDEKRLARSEFGDVLASDMEGLRLQLFSLVGIRGDTDFLVLADSKTLEPFQALVSGILSTTLGRYLDVSHSYLAMTRRSRYLGTHVHAGQDGDADRQPTESKYIFVYPFVKKREWYKLPFAERQRMMADHFKIGHKYPSIKINTGYSYGIDDQEFVLAFEGDDPSEFLALVEELRGSDVSMYTLIETPIFTCLRTDAASLAELIV